MDSSMNRYDVGTKEDLDTLLDFTHAEGAIRNHPGRMNNMFDVGGGGIYTPNGMKINGGIMTGSFADNNMLQSRSDALPSPFTHSSLPHYNTTSLSYPFPGRPDFDPTTIMGGGPILGNTQLSGSLLNVPDTQRPSSIDFPQTSAVPIKHLQENEDAIAPEPKLKRTRQSKKKKPTPEEEERKRREFLERNRQAASKSRTRKQDATAALQKKAQAYGRDNFDKKIIVATLENEIAALKKHFCDHVEYNDPELKARIERHQATYSDRYTYSDNSSPAIPQSTISFSSMPGQPIGSPATSVEFSISAQGAHMQRTGSGVSNKSSNLYHADGLLNLHSPNIANAILHAENEKAKAKDEEYMKKYRAQNKTAQEEYEIAMSIASSGGLSSEALGSEDLSSEDLSSEDLSSEDLSRAHEGSESTSLITTPENSIKEIPCLMTSLAARDTRRGMQQQNFDNPRLESLINTSLSGVSPSEFL